MKELQASSSSEAGFKWPLDLSEKKNQQYVRDMALRGVEEMFEALQHLKNWKPHRKTDAFNYFLSLLVLTGFNEEDFIKAYRKKDQIIRDRLRAGY